MSSAARGRGRGRPGRAQWIVLLTASALIMGLTFALGVLVGRQWSRPVAMMASAEAGARKTRAQADGLEKQLRQAGFDAYVTQASGEDGQTRFRVRVGTFKNKAEAQRMADRMRAERSAAAFVAPK